MIFYDVGGELKSIKGNYIRSLVIRNDLVPVPLSIEAEIRIDSGENSFLDNGKVISLSGGEELRIILSKRITSGKVQHGHVADYIKIIAVLDSVAGACFVSSRAIIKQQTSLAAIYMAAGCKIKAIQGDFTISEFSCIAGETPTFGIARALQESAGVVGWKDGKLWMKPVIELFAQQPKHAVSIVGSYDVEAEFLKRHQIPTFYSVDPKGNVIYGNRKKTRKMVFVPNKTETVLRNMGTCLVLCRVVQIAYNQSITAGDLIKIDENTNYVVITAATIFTSGAEGDSPQQFTKLWLGELYE